MQTRNFLHLFTGIIFALLFCSITSAPPPALLSYHIQAPSRLFLQGTTNVSSFNCNCSSMESLPRLPFEMGLQNENFKAVFSDARLHIRTENLDCGNRQMNRDLYHALKAEEHPMIGMVLLETARQAGAQAPGADGWMNITARARLTIAGVSRTIELPVRARQTSPGTYRFVSRYAINMTDFNIQPPTAMMGLVKVNNRIEIHFDLAVEVRELS